MHKTIKDEILNSALVFRSLDQFPRISQRNKHEPEIEKKDKEVSFEFVEKPFTTCVPSSYEETSV